jgi:hypothetical protein
MVAGSNPARGAKFNGQPPVSIEEPDRQRSGSFFMLLRRRAHAPIAKEQAIPAAPKNLVTDWPKINISEMIMESRHGWRSDMVGDRNPRRSGRRGRHGSWRKP